MRIGLTTTGPSGDPGNEATQKEIEATSPNDGSTRYVASGVG